MDAQDEIVAELASQTLTVDAKMSPKPALKRGPEVEVEGDDLF